MKTNWFKRMLCGILAFMLVLGYVPATAWAEETVPETTAETVPETTAETVPETTAETVPETTAETVPETTAETVPETTAETVPETTAETVPETTAETVPETTEETLPETDEGPREYPLYPMPQCDFVAPFASTPGISLYSMDGESGFPAAYDARDYGVVSPIKNQVGTGLCWAFATYAAVESSLRRLNGADSSVDLSEWHLAYFMNLPAYDTLGNLTGDSSPTGDWLWGNNPFYAGFAMASWTGPAPESSYPFMSDVSGIDPAAAMDDAYHLSNAYWINPADTATIKFYIMRNGTVTLGMWYEGKNLNTETNAYYTDQEISPHEVSIVGWDDNYSRTNFNTDPGADGAWLCRNSYGEEWGDGGYFWISYQDAAFFENGDQIIAFDMDPSSNYDWNYQYDGSYGAAYYTIPGGGSVANVYKAAGGDQEEIRAVGMGIASADVGYSIQIYKNPTDAANPCSGTPMLDEPQTGTTHTAGFYTVELEQPVTVSRGETFAVVITVKHPDGSDVDVCVGLSHDAIGIKFIEHTEPNQSFIFEDGKWNDLHESDRAVARVKAYTTEVSSGPVKLTELRFLKNEVIQNAGDTFSQQPKPIPSKASVGSYTWTSSNPRVATVDADGTVTAVGGGVALITAETTTEYGTFSASYRVVVVAMSGDCGEKLTWEFDWSTKRLTISGTGGMYDCTGSTAPWIYWSPKISEVVLSEGITGIGAEAFRGCSRLTSITIPGSVTSIGEGAFCDSGLTEIHFDGNGFRGKDTIFHSPVEAYYPVENDTWTQEIRDSFGPNAVWRDSSKNYLNLADDKLAEHSVVWIDGISYPIQKDGAGTYVNIPANAPPVLVTYSYNVGSEDPHTQYPTGMQAYRITGAQVERLPELDDLLQYSGCSIRITGNKGIRMITSVNQEKRNQLTGNGLADFKLLEYGTLIAQTSKLGNDPLVLGGENVKSNYAYKKGVADPVFKYAGDLIQYTNVLVGFTDEQCKEDIAMRPYMILEDETGEKFTIYGGIVYRSIGYIAYQNRNAFQPGSAAYEYVWSIIHNVYGTKDDSEYRK